MSSQQKYLILPLFLFSKIWVARVFLLLADWGWLSQWFSPHRARTPWFPRITECVRDGDFSREERKEKFVNTSAIGYLVLRVTLCRYYTTQSYKGTEIFYFPVIIMLILRMVIFNRRGILKFVRKTTGSLFDHGLDFNVKCLGLGNKLTVLNIESVKESIFLLVDRFSGKQ